MLSNTPAWIWLCNKSDHIKGQLGSVRHVFEPKGVSFGPVLGLVSWGLASVNLIVFTKKVTWDFVQMKMHTEMQMLL